jgi:AcrR family transcriptional regulator
VAAAARPRRRQADRSAETRARIVSAAVDCIERRGFAGASTWRIARAAGVSVGAVQHHFPAKDDVMAAVLDESAADLAARFAGVDVEGAALEDRVATFVERAWRHYGSPRFRATLEILLAARDPNGERLQDWAARALRDSGRRARALWAEVIASPQHDPTRQREIFRFAFAALTGLALQARIQPDAPGVRRQLDALGASLVRLLREADASAPRPARVAGGR